MAYNVNESDLAQRLSNHYAIYKGLPYFCEAKMQNGYDPTRGYQYELWGFEVGTKKASVRLDPMESTFSAASVQFGYCYDCKGSLGYLEGVGSGDKRVAWASCGKTTFNTPTSRTPEMLQCILGKHMKFSEAVKQVITGERIAAAFDRNFALYADGMFNEIQVIHKNRVIGFYTKKDGKIRLRGGPIVKLIKRKLDKLMET